MAEIVIIGAGPTGLSAAYHLEKKGFFDYKLFEKEKTVGGLCRSVEQDGFTFDFTGHLLHINDNYFKSFIENVVNLENFNNIFRKSYIYSQETFTDYPFQINLHGLPISTIAECIEGFVTRPKKNKSTSFHDWVLRNFGQGFGKYFFFPYQEKIFSYDVKKITDNWTGRFVPQTSLEKMIEGAIKKSSNESIGYNSQFYYPKTGGINFWLNAIHDVLQNPVYTDFCVKEVDMKNKIIKFTNGAQESFKELITTMPLDSLLENLEEPARLNLKKASDKLLCNSVVNFNFGINHPNISDKHWIYYPEKQYPFYRIGFWHNFSKSMVPANCSSLYGEFSFIKKSKNYVDTMLELSKNETKKLFKISNSDIATEKIINIPHAYVIYDSWRDNNISKILKRLKEHNIYSVGRYGEWKYSSMQEAILDGKKIVDELIISPARQINEAEFILKDVTKRIQVEN